MPTHERTLATELQAALGRLEEGLREAADATRTLAALAPRIAGMDALIDQIESAIGTGRGPQATVEAPATATSAAPTPISATPASAASPTPTQTPPASTPPYTRPTLVIPGSGSTAPPALSPSLNGNVANGQPTPIGSKSEAPSNEPSAQPQVPGIQPAAGEALTSFRVAFESTPGPLDLRAVDDALSSHTSVRDVALLDYDGRKATLKVWIAAGARPTDVQDDLRHSASRLFSSDAQVSIVALTEVA